MCRFRLEHVVRRLRESRTGRKVEVLRVPRFEVAGGEIVAVLGANGSGKSTILAALNIFFRETRSATTDVVNLSDEDFYRKRTDEPIEITVTFGDLSKEAQDALGHYYRQGQVVFIARAKWDSTS